MRCAHLGVETRAPVVAAGHPAHDANAAGSLLVRHAARSCTDCTDVAPGTPHQADGLVHKSDSYLR
jgi:hypothetical protein